MKIESNEIHIVDLGNEERQVFFSEKDVGEFLMEEMDNPKEMVKKAIKREELEDTPAIVRLEIPSDLLGEDEWEYVKVPFDMYLADEVL